MKVIHHVILFMLTAGVGNLIWFMFRHPKKSNYDLLMSEANLKINAASLEEQRRHNLAMEAAAVKTSQPKSNPQKSSFLGGAMRGLGNLAAANYNMVQEHQNKPVVYKCFSCKQMKTFSSVRPAMKCCGRTMVRQY